MSTAAVFKMLWPERAFAACQCALQQRFRFREGAGVGIRVAQDHHLAQRGFVLGAVLSLENLQRALQ